MDRLLDTVSVLVLAVTGGLATASLSGTALDVVLVAGGLLVAAVVALPVAHSWLSRGDEGTSRRRLATALRELARKPHLALVSLALSMIMQAASGSTWPPGSSPGRWPSSPPRWRTHRRPARLVTGQVLAVSGGHAV